MFSVFHMLPSLLTKYIPILLHYLMVLNVYNGSMLWSNLPRSLVSTLSRVVFKCKLTDYMLQNLV